MGLTWSTGGVSAYEFDLGQVRLMAAAPRVGRHLPHPVRNGGRVLGLGGTSQGAQIVLADDIGSNNNLWRFL
ncbi:hypothetical protein [Nonomuraea sp. JJY05]|uniref:hypothetical protein n=1 Tax=Nonomuraea sp. JJY05 TaxID=3350255 RepID=UPI00373E7391